MATFARRIAAPSPVQLLAPRLVTSTVVSSASEACLTWRTVLPLHDAQSFGSGESNLLHIRIVCDGTHLDCHFQEHATFVADRNGRTLVESEPRRSGKVPCKYDSSWLSPLLVERRETTYVQAGGRENFLSPKVTQRKALKQIRGCKYK